MMGKMFKGKHLIYTETFYNSLNMLTFHFEQFNAILAE